MILRSKMLADRYCFDQTRFSADRTLSARLIASDVEGTRFVARRGFARTIGR
jgi:hypothetical protein